MPTPNATQVVSFEPDGASDPRYLGQLGLVGGLTYSYALPGGADQMSCNIMQQPLARWTALNPGRVIGLYRGASRIWEGILQEPTPSTTGWALQAKGAGHYGDNYMSYHTNYGVAGDPVAKAIAGTPSPRVPLRWVAPASWPSGLYLQQPPDTASVTITDYLNDITGPGGFVWYIGRNNQLSVFQPPTTVNRLLMVTDPQARTLAGYFDWLWLRYESQAQQVTSGGTGAAQYAITSVVNSPQVTKHGQLENYGDFSSAGVMTSTAAENVGTAMLAKYVAANYAGPFTVLPGELLTVGGAPVDLGMEQAGTVVRCMLASGGYGGDVVPAPPIQFVTGAYEYDDGAETATITPYLAVTSDLPTLLSNYATVHTPKTPQSTWAIPYHP